MLNNIAGFIQSAKEVGPSSGITFDFDCALADPATTMTGGTSVAGNESYYGGAPASTGAMVSAFSELSQQAKADNDTAFVNAIEAAYSEDHFDARSFKNAVAGVESIVSASGDGQNTLNALTTLANSPENKDFNCQDFGNLFSVTRTEGLEVISMEKPIADAVQAATVRLTLMDAANAYEMDDMLYPRITLNSEVLGYTITVSDTVIYQNRFHAAGRETDLQEISLFAAMHKAGTLDNQFYKVVPHYDRGIGDQNLKWMVDKDVIGGNNQTEIINGTSIPTMPLKIDEINIPLLNISRAPSQISQPEEIDAELSRVARIENLNILVRNRKNTTTPDLHNHILSTMEYPNLTFNAGTTGDSSAQILNAELNDLVIRGSILPAPLEASLIDAIPAVTDTSKVSFVFQIRINGNYNAHMATGDINISVFKLKQINLHDDNGNITSTFSETNNSSVFNLFSTVVSSNPAGFAADADGLEFAIIGWKIDAHRVNRNMAMRPNIIANKPGVIFRYSTRPQSPLAIQTPAINGRENDAANGAFVSLAGSVTDVQNAFRAARHHHCYAKLEEAESFLTANGGEVGKASFPAVQLLQDGKGYFDNVGAFNVSDSAFALESATQMKNLRASFFDKIRSLIDRAASSTRIETGMRMLKENPENLEWAVVLPVRLYNLFAYNVDANDKKLEKRMVLGKYTVNFVYVDLKDLKNKVRIVPVVPKATRPHPLNWGAMATRPTVTRQARVTNQSNSGMNDMLIMLPFYEAHWHCPVMISMEVSDVDTLLDTSYANTPS